MRSKARTWKDGELRNVPPAQNGVQERNTQDDLDRAGDCNHEEIPSVDDVVQVRGDKVIDFSDKVSGLLYSILLFLSLNTCPVSLR